MLEFKKEVRIVIKKKFLPQGKKKKKLGSME